MPRYTTVWGEQVKSNRITVCCADAAYFESRYPGDKHQYNRHENCPGEVMVGESSTRTEPCECPCHRTK